MSVYTGGPNDIYGEVKGFNNGPPKPPRTSDSKLVDPKVMTSPSSDNTGKYSDTLRRNKANSKLNDNKVSEKQSNSPKYNGIDNGFKYPEKGKSEEAPQLHRSVTHSQILLPHTQTVRHRNEENFNNNRPR